MTNGGLHAKYGVRQVSLAEWPQAVAPPWTRLSMVSSARPSSKTIAVPAKVAAFRAPVRACLHGLVVNKVTISMEMNFHIKWVWELVGQRAQVG